MPENNQQQQSACVLYVCMGKHCRQNFSEDVYKAALSKAGPNKKIESVQPIHCLGECEQGTNVLLLKNGKAKKFGNILPCDIDKIEKEI